MAVETRNEQKAPEKPGAFDLSKWITEPKKVMPLPVVP
jgi:hypothetical protein